MENWPDWRYRLVNMFDLAWHKAFHQLELPPLCNLERRMWWRRFNERYPLDQEQ